MTTINNKMHMGYFFSATSRKHNTLSFHGWNRKAMACFQKRGRHVIESVVV